MPWKYSQSTGQLSRDGRPFAKGYSGRGLTAETGRNNPDLEAKRGYGPIPRGMWRMTGIYDSKSVGPKAIILEPVGHNAHGRSAFRIHGDNKAGDASRGCIIIGGGSVRQYIWDTADRSIEVVR